MQWTSVPLLHLLLAAAATVSARGPPEVRATWRNRRLLAQAGSTVRLTCPIVASPEPYYTWSKDGQDVQDWWQRYRLRDATLRIQSVQPDDGGTYKCMAANGFGSHSVQLELHVFQADGKVNDSSDFSSGLHEHVYSLPDGEFRGHTGEPPSFTNFEQMKETDIIRSQGSSVRLRCQAVGNPKPDIVWLRNGVPYRPNGKKSVVRSRWILVIESLRKDDSGQYTCKVFNQAGVISYNYTLQVVDRPIVMQPHPVNLTVMQGEAASFQCRVQSAQQPTIKWLKLLDSNDRDRDNTVTMSGKKYLMMDSGEMWPQEEGLYYKKLTLQNVAQEDSGRYFCMVATSMGYGNQSVYLTVLPPAGRHTVDRSNADGKDVDTETTGQKTGQDDSVPFLLPLIIALPAGVILILVLVALYVLLHRRHLKQTPPVPAQQAKLKQPEQYAPLCGPPQPQPYPHPSQQHPECAPLYAQQRPAMHLHPLHHTCHSPGHSSCSDASSVPKYSHSSDRATPNHYSHIIA